MSAWRQRAVLLAPLIVFAAALVARLVGIGDRAVWMDEDRQAGYCARGFLDLGIPSNAAKQQQPPIDYHLEALGIQSFGLTPTGIRLHAALLGALAAVLFFSLLRRLIRNPAVLVLATAAFALHPILVRYGQEARPISTGVFFSVLFLRTLLLFLDSKKRDRASLLEGAVLLTASQVALLLSVGFQPVPLLSASSLSLLPLLIIRGGRTRIAITWATTLLALILCYHVLRLSIDSAGNYIHGETGLKSLIQTCLDGVGKLSFESLAIIYKQTLDWWLPALGLGAILATAAFLTGRTERSNLSTRAYLLTFFALYPPAFFLIYLTVIHRPGLPVRYFLTFVPFALAFLAVALDGAADLLLPLLRAKRRIYYAVATLMAGVLLAGVLGDIDNTAEQRSSKRRPWDRLYEIFMESDGGTAYTINLIDPNRWSPGFWSQRFYYPNNKRKVLLKREWNLVADFKRADKLWSRPEIFLVTLSANERLSSLRVDDIPGVSKIDLHNLHTIRIRAPQNQMQGRVMDVIERMREHFPPSKNTWLLSTLLVEMSAHTKDEQALAAHCDELQGMKPHPKMKRALGICRKRSTRVAISP